MRATGIVRRIDDLGRVVIPKEVRRILRLREGDPMEIFTTSEGGVVFQKYQPFDENEIDALIGKLEEMDIPVPQELYEKKKRMEEERE